MVVDLEAEIRAFLAREHPKRVPTRSFWAKYVESVDEKIANGYAFRGQFVPRGTIEIDDKQPIVLLVMSQNGSGRHPEYHYSVFLFSDAGIKDTGIYTTGDRPGWALRIRSQVAQLLADLAQVPAPELSEDERRLVEALVSLGPDRRVAVLAAVAEYERGMAKG